MTQQRNMKKKTIVKFFNGPEKVKKEFEKDIKLFQKPFRIPEVNISERLIEFKNKKFFYVDVNNCNQLRGLTIDEIVINTYIDKNLLIKLHDYLPNLRRMDE